jgi:hypothetical protein
VFNVVWCAFVSENGEFSQEAIKDISFSNSIMERASDLDLVTYGFPTRLGRLTDFSEGAARRGSADGRTRIIDPP